VPPRTAKIAFAFQSPAKVAKIGSKPPKFEPRFPGSLAAASIHGVHPEGFHPPHHNELQFEARQKKETDFSKMGQ
jgi:hypothetical protein